MKQDLIETIRTVPLFDHHAHGVRLASLSAETAGDLLNESTSKALGGLKAFDKPVGLNLRSICAPLLDLERGASLDRYFARRAELGEDASQRLIEACGLSTVLLDTYARDSKDLTDPTSFTDTFNIPAFEILRLESLFENVAQTHGAVDGLCDAFATHLEALAPGAVGFKTILGYRAGFDIDHKPPDNVELTAALDEWLSARDAGERPRLANTVICRKVLWIGSEIARARNMPIQFHVAIGDDDVDMPANDPAHLRPYFKEMQDWGVNCTLLHCYPYVRCAQWLSDIFDNVYYDIGFMLPFGSPEIERLFREAFEIGPFHKQLYSSDAFDLAELFTISAVRFRNYLGDLLADWVEDGYCSSSDAVSIAERICHGNAERIYGISERKT